MKSIFEVQYRGKNVNTTEIEKMVKEDVKSKGVKISSIDTLNMYYTPETASVYYVVTTKDGESINNEEPITVE
ncbi:MAG: DUF6465 family protein [Thomasclavelia sp.]